MSSSTHPIAAALVDWFERDGHDYPWRRTTDPWYILVSEIMLQQTTISTVITRYEKWMEQYPNPAALAADSEKNALLSWEGLGYYRRVRALQAAACTICEQHHGIFPREEADIRALPGIGDYTVGAILSFAYNQSAPLVDANVSRVLARIYNSSCPIDSTEGRKEQWAQARELLHPSNARAYNSALMELGQRICSIKSPSCLICPIREHCRAESPEKLPIKLPKKAISILEHSDILSLCPQRGILLKKQEAGQRHEGMYRLPNRSEEEVAQLPLIAKQSYSVTRYKVKRSLYAAPQSEPQQGEQYIPLDQLASCPMASPDRKLLEKQLASN